MLRALLRATRGIFFVENRVSETKKFKDNSESVDIAFITRNAVNAQKIFLIGDEVVFLVFHRKKRDIPRKMSP